MKYYLLTIATAFLAVATIRLVCINYMAAAMLAMAATLIINDWRKE